VRLWVWTQQVLGFSLKQRYLSRIPGLFGGFGAQRPAQKKPEESKMQSIKIIPTMTIITPIQKLSFSIDHYLSSN
jgi:hypothetical protein